MRSRFTPFPNVILDRVMPHLTDTEFRILALIVRQTLGWGQDQKWLSHGWIKECTGRESAAVSRAVDGLVKRGLVIVRDSAGRRISLAAERRRSHSKLSYSIHHLFLESERYRLRIGFGARQRRSSQSENNKGKRKKEKNSKQIDVSKKFPRSCHD